MVLSTLDNYYKAFYYSVLILFWCSADSADQKKRKDAFMLQSIEICKCVICILDLCDPCEDGDFHSLERSCCVHHRCVSYSWHEKSSIWPSLEVCFGLTWGSRTHLHSRMSSFNLVHRWNKRKFPWQSQESVRGTSHLGSCRAVQPQESRARSPVLQTRDWARIIAPREPGGNECLMTLVWKSTAVGITGW